MKSKEPIARSISIGTASHAIGTLCAMEFGRIYGAYASLGLIVNGLLTALLVPLVLKLMGIVKYSILVIIIHLL